jgi:hypothetical protein
MFIYLTIQSFDFDEGYAWSLRCALN